MGSRPLSGSIDEPEVSTRSVEAGGFADRCVGDRSRTRAVEG